MDADRIVEQMTRSNLPAFLMTIRSCEGTAGDDGYKTLFGGKLFDTHPPLEERIQALREL